MQYYTDRYHKLDAKLRKCQGMQVQIIVQRFKSLINTWNELFLIRYPHFVDADVYMFSE